MEDSQTSKGFSVKSSIRNNYEVHFIEDFAASIDEQISRGNTLFIVDRKLSEFFSELLAPVLQHPRTVLIDCGEENKTVPYSLDVIRELISRNVRKTDTIVVIGGGIAQDITAFISSILFRGVDWKFYPSTLLAQCDSCIGSKSSINFDQFKNLIGTFNPPSQIFIFTEFLNTLTEQEIRSGIGEMLHYYFTEGIELADEITQKIPLVLENRTLLHPFIHHSLRIKKSVIEVDEFDSAYRHIFNYGHTFGHAIEVVTEYKIPHGQAVSIGMDMANYISRSINILSDEDFERMHVILKRNTPCFRITKENINNYCKALSRDKKNVGNRLGCILSRGPGKVEKTFLDMDDHFREILLTYSNFYGC